MTLPDKLNAGNAKPTYVDAQTIQFKTTDGAQHGAGQYAMYNKESKTTELYDTVEGVIIAKGAYLQKQIGRPSSAKSVEHKSQEFSMQYARDEGEIRIRELRRENGEFSTQQVDTGVFGDFVGENGKGYRCITCLYLFHPDTSKLYRVEFSPVCSQAIRTRGLFPKKYAKLGKSNEVFSNDYGDFAMPSLSYTADVDDQDLNIVEAQYSHVNDILNHQNNSTLKEATSTAPTLETLPF